MTISTGAMDNPVYAYTAVGQTEQDPNTYTHALDDIDPRDLTLSAPSIDFKNPIYQDITRSRIQQAIEAETEHQDTDFHETIGSFSESEANFQNPLYELTTVENAD